MFFHRLKVLTTGHTILCSGRTCNIARLIVYFAVLGIVPVPPHVPPHGWCVRTISEEWFVTHKVH